MVEEKETKKLEEFKDKEENKKAIAELEGKKLPEKKSKEKKPELVREYVVPLRKAFIKVPEYKKAKKAVKYLKEFLAKHMKVEDRDLKKVKVDKYLNNEIWFRGIRKPLPKVKVIAEKIDGIVYAKLAEVPEAVKFKMAKDKKKFKKVDKKAVEKVKKQEEQEKEIKEERSDKQDKTEEKEKEKASVETKEVAQKSAAKTQKHKTDAKPKKVESGVTQRKSLKK
jgi:large subunit ribosomal protein L31e